VPVHRDGQTAIVGLYQVQRVTLRPGRAADVRPLTDWLALPAALAALDCVGG
jgi:hypothetical protein